MSEGTLRRLFDISLILKGIHGFFELVAGVSFLFIGPGFVMKAANFLTVNELLQDPHDPFANWIIAIAGKFSVNFMHLASLYLISHGIVICFLAISLILKKLWSYPIAIAILGIFILFQGYAFVIEHSWFIFTLTMFDLLVLVLTVHEFRYIRKYQIVPRRTLNKG